MWDKKTANLANFAIIGGRFCVYPLHPIKAKFGTLE